MFATLSAYVDVLFQFCDRAVSGGYLVAIVLVCAMQYLYHLYSSHRASELRRRLCQQIDDVQNDLRIVSRERTLTTLENQILREFTGELDLDRTLDQLIRRLVPDTSDGFAAYVSFGTTPPRVTHSRGLGDKARDALVVDDSLLKRVANDAVAVIRAADFYGTRLHDSLAPGDRERFDRLFLARLGDSNRPAGVIVTTSLLPAGIPLDQQIELARRLMQSLAGIVQRSEELHTRDRQLQSINEIMELRAVTDRKHTSPLDMVEAFVDRLREMANAERAVLFLITPEGKGYYKPLCRCGIPLAGGTAKKYADVETLLAEAAVARQEFESLDAEGLARIGVHTLVGSAIVTPVNSPNGVAGALCLTRRSREPFTEIRPELINWAANYLSQTLVRLLHQAISEWHARQDPLTELFNRRSFDQEFAAVLQTATASAGMCSLLMVDIDRFKSVNDRHGHLVGDEVLRCVSRVLKESVARLKCGAAARFGGEEFAVLLPGTSCQEAAWIGETIRAAVEVMPIHTPNGQISVTVSVGVSGFPDHGRSAEELIHEADSALYRAKETGRNRVVAAAAVRSGS